MGLKAMTWAFEQPLSGNEKCVLLALADRARDDGLCWPGQDEVAEKAYVSTKTVSRIMGKLEEKGYLSRTQRFKENGERTSDLTRLNLLGRGPTDTLPADKNGGDQQTALSEEPSGEPSKECVRAGGRVIKVGGKKVKPSAWTLTGEILASFNEQAGKKLRLLTSANEPSQAAIRIYGRVAAYPDITLEEHADIIRRTLASKWWGGNAPTIGVVYGPNVFEDNITRRPESSSTGREAAKQAKEDAWAAYMADGGSTDEEGDVVDAEVVE